MKFAVFCTENCSHINVEPHDCGKPFCFSTMFLHEKKKKKKSVDTNVPLLTVSCKS